MGAGTCVALSYLPLELGHHQAAAFIKACEPADGLAPVSTNSSGYIGVVNICFILEAGDAAHIAFPLDTAAVPVLGVYSYVGQIRHLDVPGNAAHKAFLSL